MKSSAELQAAIAFSVQGIVRQAVTDLFRLIDDQAENIAILRQHKPEILKSVQASLRELEQAFRPHMKPGDEFPALD